jgi:hypothetical protein
VIPTRSTTNSYPTQNPRPAAVQLGVDSADPLAAVVADLFARADAGSLGAADTGHPWTPNSGNWGIASKQAACSSLGGAGQCFAYVEAGLTNISVRATLAAPPASSPAYLIGRFVSPNTFIAVYANPTSYQLQRCNAGTFTVLSTALQTPAAGDRLRLQVIHSTLRLYVNDVLLLTSSTTVALGGTRAGAGTDDTAARWTAFSVTAE